MLSYTIWVAAMLLCATVHAQLDGNTSTIDPARTRADAQAAPNGAVAPQHFGNPTCSSILPGCEQCTLYIVRSQAQAASSADTTAAATPETFGRKVYVCTQCMPGFVLEGSGNLNDPKPRYCVPDTGPTPCTSTPPFDPKTSTGFSNCPTTVGSICTAKCAANAFGTGLQAICVADPATNTNNWVITGFCSAGAAVCPPAPPPGSAPNSAGFQNCPTNEGGACTAPCTNGAAGPGYIARCLLNSQTGGPGAPAWVVTGSCALPGLRVKSCKNNCGKRNLVDAKTGRSCFCDYWCNLYDDCCGGMNAAAAAAKDQACSRMSPSSQNLANLLTCSNKRGTYAGVDPCSSYRPGNCWCDKFCTDARDCCNNCPLRCAATCPARTAAVSTSASTDQKSPGRLCGATPANQLALAAKEALLKSDARVGPAEYNAEFERGIQRCQAARIQTDLSADTITIPTYIASVGVGNQAAVYTPARASQLMAGINAAYARSGFQFNLVKYVDNFVFTNQDTLDADDCFEDNEANPNCERCRIYRQIVPVNNQGSKVLVMYVRPTDPEAVTLGAAYLPQTSYNPFPTSNAIALSCIDGLWGQAFPTVRQEVTNIVHEIGHWLGLSHTWNEDDDVTLSNAQLCLRQTGSNYNAVGLIASSNTDGVRDTPPQLVDRVTNINGETKFKPFFFGCNPDGSFNPNNPAQGPAKSCNGLVQGPTGGKYFNNFNNAMSYYDDDCDGKDRAKTLSADQLARARCVWDCYRDNQCGTGVFFP